MGLINQSIVATLPLLPRSLVGLFSRPYIAGGTLEHAVNRVKQLNDLGLMATLDVLGEEVRDRSQTEQFTHQYLDALGRIDSDGLDSNVSVKLSALGLRIDRELCEENLRRVIDSAKTLGNFVRLDMEDRTTTDATLELYSTLRRDYDNVGVVLQSRLFRTESDLESLLEHGVNARIVKGIYLEPPEHAQQRDEEIRKAYMSLVEKMIDAGRYVALATHDRWLVNRCLELIEARGLSRDQYEFQMLLGVSKSLRDRLLRQGHRLRIYVPFGEDWYAYSLRRLRENPQVAGHVMKNLLTLGRA